MLSGGPEEVKLAARAAIETLGREGGLILAPDQPLAFPAANAAALAEAARNTGVPGGCVVRISYSVVHAPQREVREEKSRNTDYATRNTQHATHPRSFQCLNYVATR